MTTEVAAITLVNRTVRYSSPVLFDDPLDVARKLDLGFPIEDLEVALISEVKRMYAAKDFSEIRHNPLFKLLSETMSLRASPEVIEEFLATLPSLARSGSLNSNKHLEEMNVLWQEILPQMRILCFSGAVNIIPLWATYGDNHKGVALEFHVQEATDSPWLLAKPVTYTDDTMAIATPQEWARSIIGIEKIDHSKIFERYGTVKAKNWSFQEELRVFSFKRAHEKGLYSDYKFVASDLKAIHFGYQVEDAEVEKLCGLIAHDFAHVKPYKAIVNNDTRKLEFYAVAY